MIYPTASKVMRNIRLDDLVQYIKAYQEKFGFAPTYQEIADALGYASKATVKFDLETLRDQGAVTWAQGKARTLRVVE